MGFRNYVRTIQDMEALYYHPKGAAFTGQSGAYSPDSTATIQKADAPILSTTTGVYNAEYGAQVWAQINQEANAFGVLPKTVWYGGWRVISARAAASGGGVAENAALPETIKPTFVEVSTKPKTVAHTFHVSEVQDFLATNEFEDAFGSMEMLRPHMGNHHIEMMNIMLLGDVDTVAGDNLESLDRVTSSNAEISDASLDANDADIYGIDRDAAAAWSDAQYDGNAGTDRSLTDTLITSMLATIGSAGGNTSLILTGNDTRATVQRLFETQTRYDLVQGQTFKVGVNGIQSDQGIGTGIRIATLYGIPLLTSKNVQTDTISRMYFLDTTDPEGFGVPRLNIDMAKLTQYFESGMKTGDPFGINALGNEGMYRTLAEVKCRFFKAQGKVRDLL